MFVIRGARFLMRCQEKKTLLLVVTLLMFAVQGRADGFDFSLTDAIGNVVGFSLGPDSYEGPLMSNFPGTITVMTFPGEPTTYNGQSAGAADFQFSSDATDGGLIGVSVNPVALSIYGPIGPFGWGPGENLLDGRGFQFSDFVPGTYDLTIGEVLTITRAPEPGTFALLAIGLGIIGMRECLKKVKARNLSKAGSSVG